jgi:predicted PurR-regulated permease PerM
MADTARRAAIASLVVGGIVVLALALWKLRLLIALLFLGFIIAAAMRPGVAALQRRRVPRGIGIVVHYVAIFGAVGLLLYLVVPRALDQVADALNALPQNGEQSAIGEQAQDENGFKRQILEAVERRLEDLPSGAQLLDPALELTRLGLEVVVGIFFVLASAAYWIFEREHAIDLVTSLVPRPRRKKVRDTWDLIDMKLGAYVRGQLILIVLVAVVLSIAFTAIGLPYSILIGTFAGVVELIPVIGPLAAGALAVGVGLTDSWEVALAAGLIVLVVRLLEDYIVIPRVLGEAVGLSPLLVLFSVTAVALLFGEFAVLLAIPIAAVVATLVDVVLRGKDPAEEDVPTVIFSAKETETV